MFNGAVSGERENVPLVQNVAAGRGVEDLRTSLGDLCANPKVKIEGQESDSRR